ncbi:MAG: Hint domain-containing protein [Hasllibacter sp.]
MPATASELTIDENATALQMAQTIMGDGITVTGANYYGDPLSSGIYSGADATMPGVAPSDGGVILSTGHAEDVTNASGDPNAATNTSTNTSGFSGFGPYNTTAGAQTYDSSTLDIRFVPTGDVMTLQFVFLSEEYPEYVNSQFLDMFAVYANGTEVPTAVGDVSVGGVNGNDNQNLYVDNGNDDYNTEMDGFTVTMTVTIPVNAGVENTLRLAIFDVGDANYDSNVMIAADSGQSVLVANADGLDAWADGTFVVDPLSNDFSAGGQITITHINGQPVTAGQTITLPTGDQVTLNADGTFTVLTDSDGEDFSFTYGITDASGNSDTGYVNVDVVPCFTAGTLIETDRGEIPVEALAPGDLVMTQDRGLRPLRWIGTRRVRAEGALAPVRIAGDTLGRHRMIEVSPLHRLLVRDVAAELLFAEPEVLVAARDLVNGSTIRRREGGWVTYVHLLFDRHEIVFAEGLATESFLPGKQMTTLFEAEAVAEIAGLFPELDPMTGEGYGAPARRLLSGREGRLLRAA